MDPFKAIDNLFQFLNLQPKTQFIDDYIFRKFNIIRLANTTQANAMRWANKIQTNNAMRWSHGSLDNNWLKNIEETCAEPMKNLGYANYSSEITEDHILTKTAYEIWPHFVPRNKH